jgi:hypothetical protein
VDGQLLLFSCFKLMNGEGCSGKGVQGRAYFMKVKRKFTVLLVSRWVPAPPSAKGRMEVIWSGLK